MLPEVLRYLPRGDTFNSVVYLNIGYDNVAYHDDLAINLDSPQFLTDSREVLYYLMHELAHVGYWRYHSMPDLASSRTCGELASVVKFLTHLEGMGVIPMAMRIREGGLLNEDYRVLSDKEETLRRVRKYFEVLSELEKHPEGEAKGLIPDVYDRLSCRPLPFWYITGCHMALTIDSIYGSYELRSLVEKGCDAFFKRYQGD